MSAIFYLYISLEFLETIKVDGVVREDAAKLEETFTVVVWFLTICSIVVHGLSIPLGKLGFFLPRTLSRAFTSQSADDVSFHLGQPVPPQVNHSGVLRERRKGRGGNGNWHFRTSTPTLTPEPTRPLYRIGGTVINTNTGEASTAKGENVRPGTPERIATQRTIRFPDEEEGK